MEQIEFSDVLKLKKYLEKLDAEFKLKSHASFKASKLFNLMNLVGFRGPTGKTGSHLQFYHDTLVENPYGKIQSGYFRISIEHKGGNKVRYRDFKDYVLGPIQHVIMILEMQLDK